VVASLLLSISLIASFEAIQESHEPFDDYLVRLRSVDADKRVEALRYFGNIKNKTVLPDLLKILKNDDEAVVKGWAAWALGRLAEPAAIDPLIGALAIAEKAIMDNPQTTERKSAVQYRNSLRVITGQRFQTASEWKTWRAKMKER
jgi:hypothetical protein